MTTRLFILAHAEARRRAAQYAMEAPEGHAAKFSAPTRNLEQNAKLHALFGDLAKRHSYYGRKLTDVQWKVLMISGHAIATGLGVDMVPGLEGEFVNIRESSASMSVSRMSSLIEYVIAYCAEHGVQLDEVPA